MSCTKEEIERKRLQALQRKKASQSKYFPPSSSTISNNFSPGVHNLNKSSNASPSISHSFAERRNKFSRTSHSESPNKFSFKQGRQSTGHHNTTVINTESFFGQKQVVTGTCSLISNDRFQVETSSYLPVLVNVFKTIPSRSYDIKTKIWTFHIKDYEVFMQKMIDLKSDVTIVGLPKMILETFKKNLEQSATVPIPDLSNVDPMLVNSLMPFQLDGVRYGISKGGRCMIADDMGLGKTIQALGIAHYFKDSWPLLIVAPSSVRYSWSNAILEFLPSVPTMCVHQFLNAKDVISSDDHIVIVSYDLLARAVKSFLNRSFGFVILDECHALKSIKTARYKAVQLVTQHARHVVLLSGTPLLSRPMELYTQIKLILPKFLQFQDYGVRYCAGKMQPYGWDFSGSSNMQELQLFLRATCMIRRLKCDVLQQLPTKNRQVIILNPDLIKAGTDEMNDMARKLQKNVLTAMERHSALLQYYNESGFAKQKAICDYVGKLFKNKTKCLIYAHHHNVLDAICEVAERMQIKYIRIDGRTSSERRTNLVDQFQTQNDCVAAILSITAANAGITLTAAQLVVFAELFWNPGILCQAEDRVHRIGQDDEVVIQYLLAKQTVDDYLWPMIQKKINVLNEVGLEQDFSLHKLSSATQEDRTQTTLNSFLKIESPEKDESNESETDISFEKDNISPTTSQDTPADYKELLDLNEEDFELCDWDDMP